VLANPPFNDSDWFRKDDDVRWQFGVPPKGNANFAWVQHFIHHLAPQGMAGFVLANGSMSSNQSGEGEIRRASSRPTSSTAWSRCPASSFTARRFRSACGLWRNSKSADAKRGFRDRRKQTLFIDARKLGTLIDRVHRELTDDDLHKITSPITPGAAPVDAERGQVRRRPRLLQVRHHRRNRRHGHVLTPGRYVGAEEVEDDGDPFEEKMPRLVAELHAQFAESAKLEQAIKANLRGLGYGG
jgi:type I restriction enzyme M protein